MKLKIFFGVWLSCMSASLMFDARMYWKSFSEHGEFSGKFVTLLETESWNLNLKFWKYILSFEVLDSLKEIGQNLERVGNNASTNTRVAVICPDSCL
jgi:hypothetical protein